MRVRTSGKGIGTSWRRSLSLSIALHAVGLWAIALATGARFATVDVTAMTTPSQQGAGDALDLPVLVDLTSVDTIPPIDPIPAVPVPPADDLAAAAPADRTNAVAQSLSHPTAGAKRAHTPSTDRGGGAGRPVPDPAWRRDTSTLHERLADGADSNQPSHAQTARAAASPQAVRRELVTGQGDATRTTRYRPEATAAQYGFPEPDEPGAGAPTVPGTGTAVAPTQSTVYPVTQADHPAASSEGPLDSERGRRSFDVDDRGLVTDDHASRAASNETHPSITDLTLASVSGKTREGRGSSDMAGAVSNVTKGSAPTPSGALSKSDDRGVEARTRERIYDRYRQKIRERVEQALIWPRALAIRLLQGETIVRFVVLPDGKLRDGVHVVKSSGFAEFDQAALEAVRKASPFPPMGDPAGARPQPVNLPITFSNPVIR